MKTKAQIPRTLIQVVLLLALSAVAVSGAYAATYTATVSGDWSSTATWGGSGPPIAGDTATINSGVFVTNSGSAACATLTVNGTLTVANSLALTGTLTLGSAGTIYHQTTAATGFGAATKTFSATSTYEIQNGGASFTAITFGNLNINFSDNGTLSGGTILSGNLVKGNLDVKATGSSGKFIYNNGSPSSGPSISGNLQVDGGSVVLQAGVTASYNFTVSLNVILNGGTLQLNSGGSSSAATLTVAGNWSFNGGTMTASAASTGVNQVSFTGNTVLIGGSASSATLPDNVLYNKGTGNSLAIAGGLTSLTLAGVTLTGQGAFLGGSTCTNLNLAFFTSSSSATPFFDAGSLLTINISGAGFTNQNSTVAGFNARSSTVTFNGSGAQGIGDANHQVAFNNLTINNSGGGSTTIFAGNPAVIVTGKLLLQNGVLSFSQGNNSTAIYGDFEVDNGTCNLNIGASSHNITAGGNVILAGGTLQPATAAGGTTLIVTNNWSNNGGTLAAPSGSGAGTVQFSGATATQTIGGTATSQTFSALTVNKTSGTVTAGGSTTTLTVSKAFTLTAGAFSAGTAADIFVAGNWVNTSGNFTAGSGNVTFNGGSAQTTSGTTAFNNLIQNGAGGTTLGGATTVGGNLNVASGTLQLAGQTVAVAGTTTVSGTLGMNSATGAKSFTNDVTVNNGATWSETAGAGVTFGGNLTNNGTFTASTGTHTFNGSSKFLSGTFSIPSVTVNGTYENDGTLTVNTALAGSGTLTQGANSTLNLGGTSAGFTLDAASNIPNTVAYTASGAQTVKPTTYYNLTVSGTSAKTTTGVTVNSTLSRQGNATVTLSAPPTYGPAAVLEYKGSASQNTGPELPASPVAVPNLTLNSSSGVVMGGSGTVSGALTLTSGALSIAANTLTLNGSISITGGSLTGGTTSGLTCSGASPLTLPAISSGLKNLTINNPAGVTLGSPLTVVNSGVLTLSTGSLNGAANLSLVPGDTISLDAGTMDGAPGALPTTINVTYTGSTSTTTGLRYEIPAGNTLNNLTINNAGVPGVTLGSDFKVNGTLAIGPGAKLDFNSHTVLAAGAPSLNPSGSLTMEVNKTGLNAFTGSKLTQSAGTLTYAGVLAVTATGSALTSADTIPLFTAPAYAGGFSSVTGPTTPAGFTANTTQLTGGTGGNIIFDCSSTPDSTITAVASVCSGSTGNSASVATQSGVSYLWTISNGTIQSGTTGDSITYTAAASGSIGLTCAVTNITTLCGSSSSTNVTINVPPAITTDITNQTACLGSQVVWQIDATGSGLVYQWQRDGTNLLEGVGNFTGTTGPALTNSAVALEDARVTTNGYLCVVSGTCSPATNSTQVALTVNPPSVGGTASPAAPNVCMGTGTTIGLSGQVGTIIGWESSTDNFTVTTNEIVSTDNPLDTGALTVATWFRAVVQSGSCASALSTAAQVSVDLPSVGGTVAPSASEVCSGTGTLLTLTGNTGAVVEWQSSTDNFVSTTNEIASTDNPFSTGNLDETTWFRAVVRNGTCAAALSDVAQVSVDSLTQPLLTQVQLLGDGNTQITFTNSGPACQTYRVLASESLALPVQNWDVLTTGTFTNNTVIYVDTDATNHILRFYRIGSP
jgi:hypothetical protein